MAPNDVYVFAEGLPANQFALCGIPGYGGQNITSSRSLE